MQDPGPKKTVELSSPQPSRIRRDPPLREEKLKSVRAYPTERETWTVVIGVIAFAIALTLIIFGISDVTNG
ncbi:MAG: hypothetical protein ABIW58_07970 [Sphingomicrobium sp.]